MHHGHLSYAPLSSPPSAVLLSQGPCRGPGESLQGALAVLGPHLDSGTSQSPLVFHNVDSSEALRAGQLFCGWFLSSGFSNVFLQMRKT